jgi:hypothetical protein
LFSALSGVVKPHQKGVIYTTVELGKNRDLEFESKHGTIRHGLFHAKGIIERQAM